MHTCSFFWWNTGQRNPFCCRPGWLDCRWVKGNLTGNSPVTHWHHIQKEHSSRQGNAAGGCKHIHAACNRSNPYHLLSQPERSRWLVFRLHAGHNSLSHHPLNRFRTGQSELGHCGAGGLTTGLAFWQQDWQSDNRTDSQSWAMAPLNKFRTGQSELGHCGAGSLTTGLAVWQQNIRSRHIHCTATSSLSWAMASLSSSELVHQNSATVGLAVWQQDQQSDNRTSEAGTSTAQQHPASVLSHGLFTEFRTGQSKLSHWGAGSLTTGPAVWQQDRQSDSRTSAAGTSTTQQPPASVLASGDLQPEGVFWQPGRPAVQRCLCMEK